MTHLPTDQGILTTSELIRGGLTHHDIARLVRRGDLTRLSRGSYARGRPPAGVRERHLQLVWSVVPRLDAAAVLSHHSAAAVHGLPLPRAGLEKVTITRPGRGGGKAGAVLWTRCLPVESVDVVEVAGLRVTSLARTAVDLTRERGLDLGVGVVDAAQRIGVPDEEWERVLTAAHRRPGTPAAQFAVGFRDGRSESPGESLARLRFHQVGIPRPVLQLSIQNKGFEVGRSDFAWPEYRLLGEFDGRVKYDTLVPQGMTASDVVYQEKRRQEEMCAQGWWMFRFGWADLQHPVQFRDAWYRAQRIGLTIADHTIGRR